jgi:eukaryotic-like serine/threonine-protein kinase
VADVPGSLASALQDRYRIEREIGAGGMATVYLARDLRHDRPVALKLLNPELGAVLGVERFLAEIRVTANLQHPNLLPLFDSGEAYGHLFYVMPFVEGESLRARLEREKQLPIEDALRIAVACANALDYAHGHGVIHRDLKPENILLQAGQPVVADFGIALAVSKAGGNRITQTGLSLGTPQYMSPEQATGDRVIDGRSDIYSLAAVTYEMLTGEPPHIGNTAQAIIARVLTDKPRPVRNSRSAVPEHVEAAIDRALEKLPADRYATAHEFAEALQGRGATIATSSTGISTQARLVSGRRARLRDPVVLGLGLLLLATSLSLAVTLLVRPGNNAASSRTVTRLRLQFSPAQPPRPSGYGGAAMLALRPDGGGFVFSGPGVGAGNQFFLRRWNTLDATPIAGSEDGTDPVFSPRGDTLAFLVTPHGVKVVPLSGGLPAIVADTGLADFGVYGGLDWARDGKLYVPGKTGILRVTPGSRALEPVSKLDPGRKDFLHLYPSVLPNGKGAVVTVVVGSSLNPDSLAIGIVDFATGVVKVVLQGVRARYAPTGHLLYVQANGALMAAPFDLAHLRVTGPAVPLRDTVAVTAGAFADFAVSDEGTLVYVKQAAVTWRAVWVDRNGKETPLRPGLPADHGGPRLSPDGRRLALEIHGNYWSIPLDGGPGVQLTSNGAIDRASWSADGRTLYFVSNSANNRGVLYHTSTAGGAQPEVVPLREDREVMGVATSLDGQWLIYRTNNQDRGNADILALQLGGDRVPRELVTTPAEELAPVVSPDGRWLAYSSNESGRREIYVRPFPETAQARYQVSSAGGTEPKWAKHGQEIFYRDGAGKLVAVPVSPGPTFQRGQATVLFDASPYQANWFAAPYDVTADGQRFVMLRAEGGSHPDVVVVFNFLEELKMLVGGGRR